MSDMGASSGAKKVNAPQTPPQLRSLAKLQTGQTDEVVPHGTPVGTPPRGDAEMPVEPAGSKPEEIERAEGKEAVLTSPADLPPPEIASEEEGGERSSKRAKKEQKYLETIGKSMQICQRAVQGTQRQSDTIAQLQRDRSEKAFCPSKGDECPDHVRFPRASLGFDRSCIELQTCYSNWAFCCCTASYCSSTDECSCSVLTSAAPMATVGSVGSVGSFGPPPSVAFPSERASISTSTGSYYPKTWNPGTIEFARWLHCAAFSVAYPTRGRAAVQ
eukprot:s20_g31.t1